jgi:hypothetical protein
MNREAHQWKVAKHRPQEPVDQQREPLEIRPFLRFRTPCADLSRAPPRLGVGGTVARELTIDAARF